MKKKNELKQDFEIKKLMDGLKIELYPLKYQSSYMEGKIPLHRENYK